jgi:DNA-binding XRE family transcriptional regulator
MKYENRLIIVRKSKGWTQQMIATAIGASVGSICEIEQGKHEPGITKAIAIANALKVSVFKIWPNDKKGE